MSSCCSPGPSERHEHLPESPQTFTLSVPPRHAAAVHTEVSIPAGTFAMGDPFDEGYPNDGETPVHAVQLSAFSIDTTAVSNAAFAAFVDATGYRTESEFYGTSAVFHLAVQADKADILGTATGTPWWLNVQGADWAHPAGPLSSWQDIPDHPVTQVSHADALAYCAWAGRALPTEAQWEYAARGGLEQARYPWGNELHGADGGLVHHCNIWQGTFPTENTCDDGYLTTAPAASYEPNAFGLYQTSGNVWEWCADWFLPKYYKSCLAQGTVTDPPGPTIGRGKVMRGGSYLCHDSYCNRYRLAARSSNSPESASGNLGFRTVSAPA
ncbi:Formylglycine-generating enzyme, required for sulfatase activity, contains SUMF1/FGE domain [Arthrobacter alpinus]|uniref:Formylglycine-generating enzyme, required for sulfatase activity, contains SUMF1/FGE domain n=1 Tax=Arthrobacter alpinus TaxID=656366 RepID=A0A1H5K742_9MICC|nr:formylglycine-generating enzyme family protein [Arthrobacter alpinus]SEE60490.1 Formylglycine-generating enzyme, required for sulfatase activity, contains SUMF1/FGE domain [Arthrobacter alpinus]